MAWPLLLLGVSVLVSLVLLSIVCLNCRNKRPLASIAQSNASEDYIPPTRFRRISPVQTTELNSVHPSSHLLSPISPLADAGSQRRQLSYTPTETESNPSYENPADEPNYINTESDADDPGYIVVLPEGETPPTNQSQASTPSSDVQHLYENVPKAEDAESEDRDYLNVEPINFHRSTTDLSTQSDSSSSDDEGNYVNQPPMSQPSA